MTWRRFDPLEREIEEELRFHLEMRTEANVRAGMSREEAKADAIRRLGDPDRLREQGRAILARRSWSPRSGAPWLDLMVQDMRQSLRRLTRSPGGASFTTIVLLTLGLGIGASTALFGVVEGVLMSPLPFPEADELVTLSERSPEGRKEWVSPLTYRDWVEQSRSLQDIAAWRLYIATLTGEGDPVRLQGYVVSHRFFEMMGVPMTLGRGFLAEEDRPGAPGVVILSRELWQGRFGGDPEILGRSLTIDGLPRTVVGVAGAGLSYPEGAQIWAPLALDFARETRDFRYLGVLGRRSPGVSTDDVRLELERMASSLAEESPESNEGWSVTVEGLKEVIVGDARATILGFLGGAVLLLVIAVGNVANLFMARAAAQAQAVALRRALGASVSRLARSFVVESLLLTLGGGAAGVAVAWLGTRALTILAQGRLPRIEQIGVDLGVLSFALAVSLLVGVALGLIPAVASRTSRVEAGVRSAGRRSSAAKPSHRMLEAVLTAQVGLALTLSVAATLLLTSFLNLSGLNPGFSQEGVTTLGVNLPFGGYDQEQLRTFHREALERVGSLPEVDAVGFITPMPLVLGSVAAAFTVADGDARPRAGVAMAHARVAGPGYFEAMGIGLLRGRTLRSSDGPESEPVVVVSETFARRFLPGSDPLGRKVTWGEVEEDPTWFTVVGVVSDVRFRRLTDPGEPEIYTSVFQTPVGFGRLVVRGRGDLGQLAGRAAAALHAVDPTLALDDVRTTGEIVATRLGRPRLQSTLASLFAGVASVLALVGIVGLVSLVVGHRMHEMGVRAALGSSRRLLLVHMLAKGMRPVVTGLALGVAASAGMSRIVGGLLYGVSALDAPSYVLPCVGFALAALLACLWPSMRAIRVDPVAILRGE